MKHNFYLIIVIIAEKRAKVQKELAEIDESYKREVGEEDGDEGQFDDIEAPHEVSQIGEDAIVQSAEVENQAVKSEDLSVNQIDEPRELNDSESISQVDQKNNVEMETNDNENDVKEESLATQEDFEPIYDE